MEVSLRDEDSVACLVSFQPHVMSYCLEGNFILVLLSKGSRCLGPDSSMLHNPRLQDSTFGELKLSCSVKNSLEKISDPSGLFAVPSSAPLTGLRKSL